MTDEAIDTPKSGGWLRANWWKAIIVLMLLLVWPLLAAYGWYSTSCSYGMAEEVIALSKENKDQWGGITIVGIVDARSVTETDTLRECLGIAYLSNTEKVPISYKAFEDHGRWWMEYSAR